CSGPSPSWRPVQGVPLPGEVVVIEAPRLFAGRVDPPIMAPAGVPCLPLPEHPESAGGRGAAAPADLSRPPSLPAARGAHRRGARTARLNSLIPARAAGRT